MEGGRNNINNNNLNSTTNNPIEIDTIGDANDSTKNSESIKNEDKITTCEEVANIFSYVNIKNKEEQLEEKMISRDKSKNTNLNMDKLISGLQNLKINKKQVQRDQEFTKRRKLNGKNKVVLVKIDNFLTINLNRYNELQRIDAKLENHQRYLQMLHNDNYEIKYEGILSIRKLLSKGKITFNNHHNKESFNKDLIIKLLNNDHVIFLYKALEDDLMEIRLESLKCISRIIISGNAVFIVQLLNLELIDKLKDYINNNEISDFKEEVRIPFVIY